ncbi:MAG TPA: DUF3653 domain-containing protein [Lysobacter sp.]|nr:DUF3653 domain-containing protein [Lysobacter sp.]
MKIDPMIRTELTGTWTGFGFQRGYLWTPEGHTLYPEHMAWMSLSANIVREWRLMMEHARPGKPAAGFTPTSTDVVYLRDVLGKHPEPR